MAARTTFSALVTGFPAELRQPKPLPGETLFQLVIRNHPQEWRNVVQRLTTELSLDRALILAIEQGRTFEARDPAVNEKLEHFFNFRLPSHGRTLDTLKHLRDATEVEAEEFREVGVQIIEILWPREKNPAGDESAERVAAGFGAKVIPFETGASRELNLELLLKHVHGDCLWLVPGGTRVGPLVSFDLERIARLFAMQSRCALYVDAMSSVIYRVSALKDLTHRGVLLSANVRNMARSFDAAGYTLAADEDPDNALCELEPEYGGPRRKMPPSRERTPWWKRIFGG